MTQHSSWRQLRQPLGLFLILYILIHGYSFLRLGLHQDEILDFYGQATDTYTAGGRWGTTLYRYTFGLGANIWSAPLMTGLWLSLALGVQLMLFNWKEKSEQYLYVISYALCTQLAYILAYSFLSDAVALGWLCASLSAYCLFKLRGSLLFRSTLAILLLAFSLATYQANALYFGVLVLAYALIRHIRGGTLIPIILRSAYVSVTAVVIWFIIRKLTLGLASQEALDYTIAYQKGMSQWGNFMSLDFKMKFLFIARYIKITFMEACGIMHGGQCFNAITLLALPLLGFKLLKLSKAWIGITLLLAIWLIPYALTLGLGTVQDPRTHVASSLSIAILVTLAWSQLSNTQKKCIGPCLSILLALIFIKTIYWTSEKTKLEALYYDTVCQQLQSMESLRQKLSNDQGRELKVAVFWDAKNAMRKKEFSQPSIGQPLPPLGVLNWYAAHLNIPHIKSATEAQVKQYSHQTEKTSVWPAFDSITQDGDTLYIKAGDYFERENKLHL